MSKRSVISVHTGQCGVQTGKSIWELYCLEHDIALDGSRYIPDVGMLGTNYDNFQTFYYETANGNYVPKALFVDSEPGVMDSLRQSNIGELLHENWMINNNQDCRNTMGLAWNEEFCGKEFHDLVKSQTRKLREVCDSLSGTMYYLSTCGGTGTGFTCKILRTMKEADPKAVNYAVCQTTSPSISGNPLETFNTIAYFGLSRCDQEMQNMNMHVLYDNEALYRQCYKIYGNGFKPSYAHCNQLIAMSTSSWTASLRFDGQLNVDLNEFETNLVPVPTLNLMFNALSPLSMNEDKEILSTREITLEAFTPESYQAAVDPFAFANKWADEEEDEAWPTYNWVEEAEENRTKFLAKIEAQKAKGIRTNSKVQDHQYCIRHRFFATCFMYRGDLMPASVNRAMQNLNEKRRPEFVAWVPSGFKVGINSPPLRTPKHWLNNDISRSLCCIINNTVISEKLKALVRNYRLLTSDPSGTEESKYYSIFANAGMDFSLLERIKKGVADAIDQYSTCMSVKADIEDVKEKLEATPESIGAY